MLGALGAPSACVNDADEHALLGGMTDCLNRPSQTPFQMTKYCTDAPGT